MTGTIFKSNQIAEDSFFRKHNQGVWYSPITEKYYDRKNRKDKGRIHIGKLIAPTDEEGFFMVGMK